MRTLQLTSCIFVQNDIAVHCLLGKQGVVKLVEPSILSMNAHIMVTKFTCFLKGPSPCDDADCGFYAVCVAGKDGSTSCECPLICPANYAPVCGSDNKTYSNECSMKTAACVNKTMITVAFQGECQPRNYT